MRIMHLRELPTPGFNYLGANQNSNEGWDGSLNVSKLQRAPLTDSVVRGVFGKYQGRAMFWFKTSSAKPGSKSGPRNQGNSGKRWTSSMLCLDGRHTVISFGGCLNAGCFPLFPERAHTQENSKRPDVTSSFFFLGPRDKDRSPAGVW